jgi:hypothetical protein
MTVQQECGNERQMPYPFIGSVLICVTQRSDEISVLVWTFGCTAEVFVGISRVLSRVLNAFLLRNCFGWPPERAKVQRHAVKNGSVNHPLELVRLG